MPQVDIPHFNLPFRFAASGEGTLRADVVDQDTVFDIANCVETILRVHEGWREEIPEFGSPDFAFLRLPFGEETLREVITSQEPRADILIEERIDIWDQLINTVIIKLFPRGGEAG